MADAHNITKPFSGKGCLARVKTLANRRLLRDIFSNGEAPTTTRDAGHTQLMVPAGGACAQPRHRTERRDAELL